MVLQFCFHSLKLLGFGDNEFLKGWIWILLFCVGYNQIDQVRIWIGIAFNNLFFVNVYKYM
jgi:hypothetical protein